MFHNPCVKTLRDLHYADRFTAVIVLTQGVEYLSNPRYVSVFILLFLQMFKFFGEYFV